MHLITNAVSLGVRSHRAIVYVDDDRFNRIASTVQVQMHHSLYFTHIILWLLFSNIIPLYRGSIIVSILFEKKY